MYGDNSLNMGSSMEAVVPHAIHLLLRHQLNDIVVPHSLLITTGYQTLRLTPVPILPLLQTIPISGYEPQSCK